MKTRTELVIDVKGYVDIRLAAHSGDAIAIKQGNDDVVIPFEDINEFCRQLGEWAAMNGYYAQPSERKDG